jgi:hypothetical protein
MTTSSEQDLRQTKKLDIDRDARDSDNDEPDSLMVKTSTANTEKTYEEEEIKDRK